MPNACESCVNYHPGECRFDPAAGRDAPAGECRIGPPQPTPALDGPRWPLVWAADWCGCHLPAGGGPPLRVFHDPA